MPKPYETIVTEISAYIENNGAKYPSWYVGVAKNPRERLFEDHKVREEGDAWIFREAESREVADRVEGYFVQVKKAQGGPGGGDEESASVYAYLTGPHTMEDA